MSAQVMSSSNSNLHEMRVSKRQKGANGKELLEIISFDKISDRIRKVGQEANIFIDYISLVMKVVNQLYDKIPTSKIDELAAEQCASMSSIHPDYNILAGRIIISNHHKNTSGDFVEITKQLYEYTDMHGTKCPLVSKEQYANVIKYMYWSSVNGHTIDYSRDYLIDYFGFKTLDKSYLMKLNGVIVERPQDMWLRVSIGIHGDDCEKAHETYNLMSQKYFTHATPTLYNSGTPHPQLSSCFLQAMESDSIDGIFSTLKEVATISKWAGGIGLHIHNVRATGSHIRGTNGTSNGIVPMLRVFNNTAKYVDQCVVPETIIYTKNGPIQIQNCSIGETEIYNFYGETEVIQDILEHTYDGEMLEIKTMHSIFPLKITPKHPIFCLTNQPKGQNYSTIVHKLDKKVCDFEWTESDKLTQNDLIVYPIPKYEKDDVNITRDDCYMYGALLGYNGIVLRSDGNHQVATNKWYIRNFFIDYLDNKTIPYTIESNGDISTIKWNKTINLPFRYNDFYDENNEKRIHHKWLNLPIEKSKYIIEGIIDICGRKEPTDLVFINTFKLTESVRFLCMKLGVLTTGCDSVENCYEIRIPLIPIICDLFNLPYIKNKLINFMRYNNFLLTRVQDITKSSYSGTLYDLQLKTEHNYMIHNGLIHNGGGKRAGGFAVYLEPWHADIEMFLQMRKNHGDESLKARDLFYALWIPDLFMARVKSNDKWTLMCPDECKGLSDVYGEEFNELYTKYESEGKGRITMNARDLWFQILDAQMETGTPYLLYKDAVNTKSNQKNIGTIKSSNLCCEINQYSDETETAVCNLASLALPAFFDMTDSANPVFDYEKLHEVTKIVTGNLNRIIDINFYPTEKAKKSNMRHRPIGMGIQGLADVFMIMGVPFTSPEARAVNKLIFETMYHAALEKSCEMAKQFGTYETFAGSPASQGILQFDMWKDVPDNSRYDWTEMEQNIRKYGLRNSLLLAPMPTASTSQILGNNECIEPITSNIYSRRTMAGEFIVANKYLMRDLIAANLWNDNLKNNIIANNGSIQQIDIIPKEIRDKYLTVWEMDMKALIDMSADRGAFICQSQSLNLWQEDPTYNSLTSMHFYAWQKGLKTGIYYLRRRAAHRAQQFTIEPTVTNHDSEWADSEWDDSKHNNVYDNHEEVCDSCGA